MPRATPTPEGSREKTAGWVHVIVFAFGCIPIAVAFIYAYAHQGVFEDTILWGWAFISYTTYIASSALVAAFDYAGGVKTRILRYVVALFPATLLVSWGPLTLATLTVLLMPDLNVPRWILFPTSLIWNVLLASATGWVMFVSRDRLVSRGRWARVVNVAIAVVVPCVLFLTEFLIGVSIAIPGVFS